MPPSAQRLWCRHLHQPGGWLSPGVLHVDARGMITAVTGPGDVAGDTSGPQTRLDGWVVPGMPNVHSHAFQRALVGLAECTAPGHDDSFWTWREAMYQLALSITPDDLEAIAAQLYVEMLEAGMTAVGEFHYLHHDRDGSPYSDRAEMSHRIAAAAAATGIGLTHLPVLYTTGDFDAPATPRQRRFLHADVDSFIATTQAMTDATRAANRDDNGADEVGMRRLGVAPHSLRAVPPEALAAVVAGIRDRDPRAPVHIHIAEQTREVQACIAVRGARPVRWLLDTRDLDDRWCLIHATHLDDGEVRDLAAAPAIVGLCPTTEANLGDGVFGAREFCARGGRFAIGSDSHVTVDAASELRTLEYGQRLVHRRRNLLCDDAQPHVGRFLWDRTARAGADALDQPIGALVPGRRADLVTLDPDHPRLAAHGPDTVLDAWILGAAAGAVRDVYVAGSRRVADGHHRARDAIARRYRAALARLLA